VEHGRVAEERFRMLVERTPAIVYQERPSQDRYEVNSSFVYLSPQIQTILGYPAETWEQEDGRWLERIHPHDRERVLLESERTARSGEPYRQDYRMIAQDGRVVWFHDEAVLIRGEGGRPLLWQGVMVDITEQKEAEEQLFRAEERYRALVENIPAVIYTQPLPGSDTTFYISPQVTSLMGYTPDEWAAQSTFWRDRIHPDDVDVVTEANDRTNETFEPYMAEYRFRCADGSYTWVHDEAVVVTDDHGTPQFWQGFIFDVSERKRAEEQLREAELKFRTIVEQNQAVFYMQEIDPNDPTLSNTVYVAPGNDDLIGYSTEEVLADPGLWRSMIHPDDRDRVLAADAASNAGRTDDRFSEEYRMIRKGGEVVWVQDEAVLVRPEGRPPYWQGFLLDITERKEAEARLERALEVEREATQRLRALDEMKNTFLQAVSHDLRTPLAAILGLAVTLGRSDVTLDDDDARDLARRIADNARRLERLVTNLLDMDRLARGIVTPKLEPADVAALVRRVLDESAVDERRLEAQLEPVVVPVDAAKVERVVENLLANTVRHTPHDGHVWVSVRPDRGGVLLVVEDDGPGVPPELRDTIFEPFRQGPDAPRHSPGVGVGLTLVRRFAELHGGRAWVEEREGGGASFRVFLPGIPSERAVRREAAGA
jgi:PAS domain S-box-containing protein